MAARTKTLREEILDNAREDRMHLNRFVSSITQILNSDSETKTVHERLGEVAAKYMLASVKINEQLVEVLKMDLKTSPGAADMTQEEVEEFYVAQEEEGKDD